MINELRIGNCIEGSTGDLNLKAASAYIWQNRVKPRRIESRKSPPDLSTGPPEQETGVLLTGLWRFFVAFFH
jgi:hypothetical protein